MLKKEGYSIDESRLHVIGLSNGGSASNIALQSFDKKFKTITYISTSCDVVKKTQSKVLLIGGGKDNSSNNLPTSAKRLRRCGTRALLLFDEKEKHYMLIHQKERIIDFLNHELDLD